MNSFRSSVLGGKAPVIVNPVVSIKQGHDAKAEALGSVDIPRDAVRTANHRDSDRHRLQQEVATIIVKGKPIDVELINLSGGGAMIRCDLKPRMWSRIDLSLGEGLPIECAVRWRRDDRIGLEFAHETQIDCPPAKRDALLLDVLRRSFPDVVLAQPAPAPAKPVVPERGGPGRRAATRHPLIWTGEILFNHDSHRVRLRNISASGALIDNPGNIPAGAEVMLMLGDAGDIFATVGWSRSGQAGLAFVTPFDIASLAGARPEIATSNVLRPAFPDARDNHAWAPEWDRAALEEMAGNLEGFLKR